MAPSVRGSYPSMLTTSAAQPCEGHCEGVGRVPREYTSEWVPGAPTRADRVIPAVARSTHMMALRDRLESHAATDCYIACGVYCVT